MRRHNTGRRVVCAWWLAFAAPCLIAGLAGCSLRHKLGQALSEGIGEAIAAEFASRMVLEKGLVPGQVIQRDTDGYGTIRCGGSSKVDGTLWAAFGTIERPDPDDEDYQLAGEAKNGLWSATLPRIPAGGPYRVAFLIKDQNNEPAAIVIVQEFYVGDLWILAGQSNMHGVGDMMDVEEPSPFVRAYEMNETWAMAQDPLHRLNESPDRVHHRGRTPEQIGEARQAPRRPAAKGAGLGLPFAKELYARTGVPIGLVPCAHGGTSMDQWDPLKREEGGRSLYGSMHRRFQAVGGRVRGVLWYQGESDANPNAQPVYREKMIRFIESVRRDFGDSALPFYMVQISRVIRPTVSPDMWSAVREDQRLIGDTMAGVVTVSAIDLELDDLIHIGTQGLKRLGRRLALVAAREVHGETGVETGPRLRSVQLDDPKAGVIRVAFDGVNGRLQPREHIAGFSLRLADGSEGPQFYDVMVDPNAPDTVLCQYAGELPAGLSLWYGYGTNPYCNLTDSEDMAVCAFGPIALTTGGE